MISVAEHVREPDGSVRLVLRLAGPLLDELDAGLVDVGGSVTRDGDDVLVAWTWPAGMVPPDAPGICAAHVRTVLEPCAAAYAAPQGLTLTEPGTPA